MRVLVVFPASLCVERGTPLRSRHLALALAAQGGVEVAICSRDASQRITRLTGLCHYEYAHGDQSLRNAIDDFCPTIIYAQTHGGMRAVSAVPVPAACSRIADVHGQPQREILNQTWRPLPRRVFSATRKAYYERIDSPKMDGFTVVSTSLEQRFRRYGKPVEVVWGGVDPKRVPAVTGTVCNDTPREGGVKVVYAGNFRPYQGVETLLSAIEQLVTYTGTFVFELIGDLSIAPSLNERVKRLSGHGVRALGVLPYDAIPAALASADVLVVPRPNVAAARFGYPSKLPEYLAMGKTVIVSDVGDQGMLVRDGISGMVFPAGDSSALADCIRRSVDPAFRKSLGSAAREIAIREFLWPEVGAKVVTFFKQINKTSNHDNVRV